MGDFETILVDVAAPVATVTLNRPEQMNGITNRMVIELTRALGGLAADPDVRVIVLTGAGRAFCPGADLKHFSAGGPDDRLVPSDFAVATLLHEAPAITVAAVNGACAGAGLGWAAACDLRFAARSAVFNTAFLAVAVAGDMGLPWTLPRLLGAAKARELLLFPEKLRSEQALELGLVHRVFDDDAFTGEVAVLVDRLAGAAPLALRGLKANLLAAERMSLADFVELESERHLRIAASADTKEAFAAFVAKRTPSFEGR